MSDTDGWREFGILGSDTFIGVGEGLGRKRPFLYETKPGSITILASFTGPVEAEAFRKHMVALACANSGIVVEDETGKKRLLNTK